jgi:hypothetical protein
MRAAYTWLPTQVAPNAEAKVTATSIEAFE